MESRVPEFIVFFNDPTKNDFNTLYHSMPSDRLYFVAGVPGMFHGRLFPESLSHVFHCVTSLHRLSQAPEELSDDSSRENWKKGRIHNTGALHGVVEEYRVHFARDMAKFLDARAMEIVVGGLICNNGRFTIETLELTNPASWLHGGKIDMQGWTDHARAAMEGLFATTHFSPQLVNKIFGCMFWKLQEHSERIESRYREKVQLLVILRRV